MPVPDIAALRLAALTVSVLNDIDLQPTEDGIVLTGPAPVAVSWAQCRLALAGHKPESEDGCSRLASWLVARRAVSEPTSAELARQARPVALPRGHRLHPGPDWVREHVLGGILDVGLGILIADRESARDVLVVPPSVWAAAGIDPAPWWPLARDYLSAMSLLAAQRRLRAPRDVLRPMGDCDVVTLLADRGFRAPLAATAGGMAAVAVPMRRRGWTELRAIDPAFAVAAAALTAPEERGFAGPLLVTPDEVVLLPTRASPSYR